MKACPLINLVMLVLHNVLPLANGMVLHGETFSHLDLLVQKSLRYKHHKLNYIQSLEEGIIPSELKIKKKPAFQPVSEDFEVKWNSILYNAERNIVELLLYEAEKVIAKIQVEIQEEVNEQNPEKFERRYAELERQHSHFQRKLDQRRRKKWKKVKERNIKNHEKNNILASTGINSSSSIIQSKVVNKTRNETINNSLFQTDANDSIQLKKGNVSFSQLERTATEKLSNSGDGFSNFAIAKLKVDETFITDNRIARKNKSYAEAVRYHNTSTCANTTDLSRIYWKLLACEKSNSSNSGTSLKFSNVKHNEPAQVFISNNLKTVNHCICVSPLI